MVDRKPLKRASRLKRTYEWGDSGYHVGTISDPEFCVAFTKIVTDFVYLENRMASVLAVLIGSNDRTAGAFVMSAMTSPAMRVRVMENLLHNASLNEQRGISFDEIIKEFSALSQERNAIVHGKWWTSQSGQFILDQSPNPDQSLVKARAVRAEELTDLSKRMLGLHGRIGKEIEPLLPELERLGT